MENSLESSAQLSGGIGIAGIIIYLALVVFMIAAGWKLFSKAGKPGWAVLVPIYNIIVTLEIVGKPAWWIVLFLIPIANIIAAILIAVEFAKVFGKGGGFAVGLILLPYVFYPILAFGGAQYTAPAKA